MSSSVLAHPGPLAIDLNQPGTYLHWSIFTVSVANLRDKITERDTCGEAKLPRRSHQRHVWASP